MGVAEMRLKSVIKYNESRDCWIATISDTNTCKIYSTRYYWIYAEAAAYCEYYIKKKETEEVEKYVSGSEILTDWLSAR